MASTRGRQVVIPLTNKSGGSVAAGDVVVVDTSNNEAFTTSTSGRVEGSVGIAQEAIANNATGRVLIAGYAALVNVPSSVTRGHYVETHTVAKQATGNSTRRSGSFGQFLTGGTTPTAVLWGQTDQTASGGVTFSGARVYRSTTQSITSGADRVASFDSERYDTDSYHESVTNPTRLTVPSTGKYRIGANIGYDLESTGAGSYIAIKVNNAIYAAVDGQTGQQYGNLDVLQSLTAGDYVELILRVGTSRTLQASDGTNNHYSADFWIEKVG